jgi:hypothetical protein
MINSSDCIRNARECMGLARQANSEEVKVELLQLATAWMELEHELGRKQGPLSLSPDAPGSGVERLKECLSQAEMCRALAADTIHPRRRAQLLELAAEWVLIAGKIEHAANRV